MFSFRKHKPDRDSLIERLTYLENFLENLSDKPSDLANSIKKEIDKIREMLSGLL